MEFLKHAHSGWRWVVLLLLIAAIANAFSKRNNAEFGAGDKKIALFALIASHIQLLFGLVLYFISPRGIGAFQIEGFMKDSFLRFHAIEHVLVMILGIVLITVGFSRSKRATEASAKFKAIWLFYGIGLLLILSRIPWPFQAYGAGWF